MLLDRLHRIVALAAVLVDRGCTTAKEKKQVHTLKSIIHLSLTNLIRAKPAKPFQSKGRGIIRANRERGNKCTNEMREPFNSRFHSVHTADKKKKRKAYNRQKKRRIYVLRRKKD